MCNPSNLIRGPWEGGGGGKSLMKMIRYQSVPWYCSEELAKQSYAVCYSYTHVLLSSAASIETEKKGKRGGKKPDCGAENANEKVFTISRSKKKDGEGE